MNSNLVLLVLFVLCMNSVQAKKTAYFDTLSGNPFTMTWSGQDSVILEAAKSSKEYKKA